MRKILLTLLLLTGGILSAQLPTLPLDFESGTLNYTYTDFDGGGSTVINNPDMSGINTSSRVTQMVKSTGQPWGGSWIQLAGPMDFSVNKIFKAKVWSPRVGARMLLKVENGTNGGIFFEKEDTTTTANAWEELTFDYSLIDVNQTYEKIVVIFDLGVVGDGSSNFTFFFDDIELTTGGGGPTLNQIDLPVTFEDTTVDYTLTDFGGNASMLVPDPTNPANTVAEVTKGGTAELWAGTTIGTPLGFANAIPFTQGNTVMSVDVWSPDANIPIRLKVEDRTLGNISCETEATVTMASAWETLEFDFTNEVPNTPALDLNETYEKASIFFNFGTDGATAGSKTYYFDNVVFGSVIISNDPARENLRFFPNPATSQVNIRSDRPINSVQVFDLTGKEMIRMNTSAQQVNVDVSALAPGMYIFTTESFGKSDTFRVVVQ